MNPLRPADWLTARRDDAAHAGKPLPALAGPAVLPVGTGAAVAYVHKRGSRVVATDMLAAGQSQRVDGTVLMNILNGQGVTTAVPGAVVIPDVPTLSALVGVLSNDRPAQRALELARSLSSSAHVVVLTEALERKFFAPTGMETESIATWRAAFGLSGLSAIEADKRLYKMVVTGEGGLAASAPGLVSTESFLSGALRKAENAERSILSSLAYTGLASECSRFNDAGIVASVWSFITATDPERREGSRLDGTVFTAKVVKTVGRRVYARIAPPFKAKVGRRLVVLDQYRPANTSLDKELILVDVEVNAAREFVAEFETVGRTPLTFATGDTVDLIASPFIPTSMRTTKTQWTTPAAEGRREYRDVPLAVSLAGAPEEGASAVA